MIYGEAEQEGFAQKVSCGGGRAAERGGTRSGWLLLSHRSAALCLLRRRCRAA